MKFFTLPITLVTTGYITIAAESLEEAKKEAHRIDNEGVGHYPIEDQDFTCMCDEDEVEELIDEDDAHPIPLVNKKPTIDDIDRNWN